jgi:hypothetical protein
MAPESRQPGGFAGRIEYRFPATGGCGPVPVWHHAARMLRAGLCVAVVATGGAAWAADVEPSLYPWLDEPALLQRLDPQLGARLVDIYREISHPPTGGGAQLLEALLKLQCEPSDVVDAELALLDARRRAKERDYGVNFDAGTRIDPDTGDADSGGHHVYAGLSWSYLGGGLWGNRLDAEELGLEGELEELRREQTEGRRLLDCRAGRLIAAFNDLKIGLLGRRERYLRLLHEVYRNAYLQGLIHADEVILIERDRDRTRQFEAGFRSYNETLARTGGMMPRLDGEPPFVDLDIRRLIAAVESDPAWSRMAAIEKDLVDNHYDRRREMDMRYYVHPRLKWDDKFATATDLVAGMTFRMPLAERRSEPRDIEASLSDLRQIQARRQLADTLLRMYYEYQYRLDDAIRLDYQRRLVLERLRRAFAALAVPAPTVDARTLPALLQGVRDLIDTQFELLDNGENLYARLLRIFAESNQPFQADLLLPVRQAAAVEGLRPGSRAMYIWSRSFNEIDNALLIQILRTKSVTTAVVSAGRKTDAVKLEQFLALAAGAGLRVELMVSDNGWVRPRQAAEVDATVARLLALAPHLHLDVEPHTFDDFRADRTTYMQGLAALVERVAAAKKPGQSVSVALPTLLTREEVDAVAAHADVIYAMAYGIDQPDKLLRRLESFAGVPRERLVVALRPQDFASELALEDFIRALGEQGGLTGFAFHDFEQFRSVIETSQ